MNKKPLVSFIIRTKNESLLIGKVLKTLQKQTISNFEVLVIDSGSSDNTLDIVKKYPVKIFRIKQSNFTYGYALNYGIRKSLGKYICIISGHSLPISDNFLESGIKILEEPKVAGVSGPCPDFAVGYLNRFIGRIILLFESKRSDYSPWMTNTNSMIKRKMWKMYNFDESLPGCEDYDWGKEMIFRGYNVVKTRSFGVFHSHWLLGKPGYFRMQKVWREWNKIVDSKSRPSIN